MCFIPLAVPNLSFFFFVFFAFYGTFSMSALRHAEGVQIKRGKQVMVFAFIQGFFYPNKMSCMFSAYCNKNVRLGFDKGNMQIMSILHLSQYQQTIMTTMSYQLNSLIRIFTVILFIVYTFRSIQNKIIYLAWLDKYTNGFDFLAFANAYAFASFRLTWPVVPQRSLETIYFI